MARTWAVSARKLNRLRTLDRIGRLVTRSRGLDKAQTQSSPRNILVVEAWHLGDVVLTTPLLQALRLAYPDAKLTMLGKAHAEPVLRHTGLIDDFIVFDFPWTAFSGKYRLSRYRLRPLLKLFRRLRGARFDLTIDARMDLRSNVVTYLTGASRRIGFDFGGGSYLLTDAVPANPDEGHKVDDWHALLGPLRISSPRFGPRLAVSAEERARGLSFLESNAIDVRKPIVAIHAGASQPVREWPIGRFGEVAAAASRKGAQVIVFNDPKGLGEPLETSVQVTHATLPLRDFLAVLEQCDLLVCNDSGPMHMAAALGVKVVAVFGPQRPEWYGPYGEGHRVVIDADVACRPCFDSCRFAEPFCITGISADRVVGEVLRALDHVT